MTLYRNGNTSFTYSGTKYTDTSKAFTICTIPATHNGTAQDTSCSITSPTITAASGFTVVGYNTSATATSTVGTAGDKATLSINTTVRIGCNCYGASALTVVLVDGAGVVNNLSVRVVKV